MNSLLSSVFCLCGWFVGKMLNAPKSIEVYGADHTYRKRGAIVDENTGNVTQVSQYLETEEAAVYDLDYDEYGNLEKITRPANSKGERLSMSYKYDETVYSYVEEVTNESYGYTSSAKYDFSFGQVVKSMDINGNEISYQLDDLGRVHTIMGPYEKAAGKEYTIQFDFRPDAEIPYAVTRHFDPEHEGNDLETVIFVDGLGRVLQTKKDFKKSEAGRPKTEVGLHHRIRRCEK